MAVELGQHVRDLVGGQRSRSRPLRPWAANGWRPRSWQASRSSRRIAAPGARRGARDRPCEAPSLPRSACRAIAAHVRCELLQLGRPEVRNDLLLGELAVALACLGRDIGGAVEPGAKIFRDGRTCGSGRVPASAAPSSRVSSRCAFLAGPSHRDVARLALAPDARDIEFEFPDALPRFRINPRISLRLSFMGLEFWRAERWTAGDEIPAALKAWTHAFYTFAD